MNPLTNTRNITKLSQRELQQNDGKTSWHDEYKGSAWVFVGGLPYDLSEGDVIAVFSQYGEIVNINLCRDKVTGKQKGFAFVCYEDQRSTVLAVDNFNGIKILNRTIRVDHVKDYKPPKDSDKLDDITRELMEQGCAPKEREDSESETALLLPLTDREKPETSLKRIKDKPDSDLDSESDREKKRSKKKSKKSSKSKKKKEKKSRKHKRRSNSSSSESGGASRERRKTSRR